MLWLPWATHRKVWHKMAVTATRALGGRPNSHLVPCFLMHRPWKPKQAKLIYGIVLPPEELECNVWRDKEWLCPMMPLCFQKSLTNPIASIFYWSLQQMPKGKNNSKKWLRKAFLSFFQFPRISQTVLPESRQLPSSTLFNIHLSSSASVHGRWSAWDDWSECSVSCGRGNMRRLRHCNSPLPRHGGRWCPGSNIEHGTCRKQPCPGEGSCKETAELVHEQILTPLES